MADDLEKTAREFVEGAFGSFNPPSLEPYVAIILELLQSVTAWEPGDTAPKDGKPFWGWLYDEGIHLMRWSTAQEAAEKAGCDDPDEYISCFVKVASWDDGDWTVAFWLPRDAISTPTTVGLDPRHLKWRDKASPLEFD